MRHALIFDFGGVLMKTASQAPRWAWDDRLNLPRGSVERAVHGSEAWRQAQRGQIPPSVYWQQIAAQLGLSEAEVRQLEHDYFSEDHLDQAMVDFIRQRRAAGQRIGLLSNDSIALNEKLARLGIESLFDPIIISAQIGVMKPAPEAYHHILHRMEITPQQAVFIDDLPANIEAARAIGMTGILYTPDLALDSALSAYTGDADA